MPFREALENAASLAQQFPFKPMRIIVPFPTAGAVDATTRILGERLANKWASR